MSAKSGYLLQDDVIGLRAPEPADTEAYLAFRNDLGAVGDLIGYIRGVPRHKVAEWIATIDNRAGVTLTAISLSDNRPVGYVNVSDIDAISGTCRIGLAIFAPADRGKGLGRRIMDLMLAYCREWLNIRKVNLIVLADNKAAVTLYEKCGFVIEGTLKDEYFLDGRYRTALTMARFLQ